MREGGVATSGKRNGHDQSAVRSWHCRLDTFFKPDLFHNNVAFDNTTPSYLINLLWKLGLRLELDLQLHYFRIFRGET